MINMKRFVYIIASLLMLSCTGAGGFDEQEGTNPLSECVLSATEEAGGEGFIQWNGFTKDAKVDLVSSAGNSYDAVVDVVTSSGLVFLIPSDIPAGVYKVKVSMSGKVFEAGEIEIIASEKKPEDEDPEQDPEDDPNEGEGDEPGSDPQPDEDTDDDPNEGTGDDTSGDGPEPETPSAARLLKRLEYYSPYLTGSQLLYTWEINRASSPTLLVSEYIVDASGAELSRQDEYVGNNAGYFEQTRETFYESNHVEMTYLMDSAEKVTGADVLVYGKSKTTRYTWEYDSQDRLMEISYIHATKGELALVSLSYEGNLLTGFDLYAFEYGTPSLINADGAVDVVWAYMTLSKGYKDPALYIPYLMGWYNVSSESLPTVMYLADPSGSGNVVCNLNYEFDLQGYVTAMNWKEGNSEMEIVFIYE